MLNTREEIIEYLEQELEEATEYWLEMLLIDKNEAMKYRVKANTLENILDDLDLAETIKKSSNAYSDKLTKMQRLSKVTLKISHYAKRQKDSILNFNEVMSFLNELNPTDKQVTLVIHYLEESGIEIIQPDSK